MKLKDIINESATDIVARFYKEASAGFDSKYNPEDAKYKDDNKKYYDDYFGQWFKEDITPVFLKPVDKPQPEFTVNPKQGQLQSPGFRGREYSLAAAGLPYNKRVQAYSSDSSRALAAQTMDGARNRT